MTMALASLRREGLRSEERAGLVVAAALHVALVAVLLFQPAAPPPPIPERMVVSLAEDVGLESEAPELVSESRASAAPTIAEEIAPSIEVPEPAKPKAEPRPTLEKSKPQPKLAPRKEAALPKKNSGGARNFDQAFAGAGSSTDTSETRVPASQIGASAKASIVQAIVRQIRPHWTAPTGVDAEQLVTELSFDLDENGNLKGRPRVLRQSGINDSNRPQANLHAERAIRAVQLAAPFDLPGEYYEVWKSVRGARFDRNLSR